MASLSFKIVELSGQRSGGTITDFVLKDGNTTVLSLGVGADPTTSDLYIELPLYGPQSPAATLVNVSEQYEGSSGNVSYYQIKPGTYYIKTIGNSTAECTLTVGSGGSIMVTKPGSFNYTLPNHYIVVDVMGTPALYLIDGAFYDDITMLEHYGTPTTSILFPELCRFDDANHPSLFTGTLSTGYDSFIFRCFADPTLLGSGLSVSSIVATVDGSSTPTQMARVSSGSDYWETALLTLVQPTKTITGVGTYYIPHTVKFTATLSDNSTLESDTYYFVSLLKNGPTTPEKTFYQGAYDADSHWICDTPTDYYNDSGSLVALSDGNDAWVSLVEGAWTSIVTNLLTVSAAGSYSSTVGYIPSDSNVLFYGEGTAIISQKKLSISGAKISTKTYNASTAATVNLSSAVISGIVSGDAVAVSGTGVFENYDYGNQKNVTVTYTLSGADKDNYLPPDSETLKGNINKRRLTVNAENITILDKDYDGTTCADVSFSTFGNTMSIDIGKVSVSAVGTFVTSASSSTGDPNVGENKPVRIVFSVGAGANGDRSSCYAAPNTNSSLTADINTRPINIFNIQSQSN